MNFGWRIRPGLNYPKWCGKFVVFIYEKWNILIRSKDVNESFATILIKICWTLFGFHNQKDEKKFM